MCSFYSSMLDASSFVSYYFEYRMLKISAYAYINTCVIQNFIRTWLSIACDFVPCFNIPYYYFIFAPFAVILSYYNMEESKDVFTLVYIIFLALHLLSMVIISKLKKT